MKTLIIGAGPLGSLYAVLLHKAGNDVTILARNEHYSYLKENGVVLINEFTQEKSEDVQSFEDYLQLEDRLFKQLDEKVYSQSATGPDYKVDRYSPGSAADPRNWQPDWNRSFELTTNQPR